MKYEVQDIVPFGEALLDTEDLDSVYCALYRSNLSSLAQVKFIFAWMMYYHVGLAGHIITQRQPIGGVFMSIAQNDKNYPRGSQRKHHRKEPAILSAQYILDNFKGAWDWALWTLSDGYEARAVFDKVCEMRGWGPCFGWRVPDFWEALDLFTVDFDGSETDLIFSNPRKGAIIACEKYGLDTEGDPCLAVHNYLIDHLGHREAPPSYRRAIGLQETETILCKWKSHIVGRYEVGRDTLRSKGQFEAYPDNEMVQELLEHLPKME